MINIYNKYHTNKKLQKRIINKNSFTYGKLVGLMQSFINTDLRILDLGCGVGTIDFYLSNNGCKVTGVDISSKAIVNARNNAKYFRLKDISFVNIDVFKFKNNKPYDIIICNEIIEHVKDDKDFIRLVRNNIKKGGLVFLSTPLESAPLKSIGLLENFDRKVGHLRRYSYSKLKMLVERNGFQIINTCFTEGVFRNFLFTHDFLSFTLKLANKFKLIAYVFEAIDNTSLKLFGPSNISLILYKK